MTPTFTLPTHSLAPPVLAKPDAFIMQLADDWSRSVILDQVEMGVAVRQAVLELLTGN